MKKFQTTFRRVRLKQAVAHTWARALTLTEFKSVGTYTKIIEALNKDEVIRMLNKNAYVDIITIKELA